MKLSLILNDNIRKNLTVISYDDVNFVLSRVFKEYGVIIQPYEEIGRTAIRHLYHMIETAELGPVQVKLRSNILFPLVADTNTIADKMDRGRKI